jgi:hypothetical protein
MSKERAQEILRQDSAEGKLDSKLTEYLIAIVE